MSRTPGPVAVITPGRLSRGAWGLAACTRAPDSRPAPGRGLMRVGPGTLERDARYSPAVETVTLMAGDAALALALAALAAASPPPATAGGSGRQRRPCPAAAPAAGVAVVAPGLGAGHGGRGHAGHCDRGHAGTAIIRDAHVAGPVSCWSRCCSVAVAPTADDGLGRHHHQGRPRPGRSGSTATGAPWAWRLVLRFLAAGWLSGAYVERAAGRATTAAASRNWRPDGRSPRSGQGRAPRFTTSSPTPSA